MELKELKTLGVSNVEKLKPEQATELQKALSDLGYYTGAIDGIAGVQTKNAWRQFKKDNNLSDLDLVGAGSIKCLETQLKAPKLQVTSAAGMRMIGNFEGKVNHVYDDGFGYPTIGIGHLIKPGESFPKTLTDEEVYALFKKDLVPFEKTVRNAVKVVVTQQQFDALISLTFNIGEGAFLSSSVLRNLNKSNYKAAADSFLLWNKAGGQVVPGLVSRREAEKSVFLTNKYPWE
jgi:lysozyme